MAAIYGLTKREQQVVELALRGMPPVTLRGFSASRHTTTQEHLGHIFAKVGVASRGELVAALFFGGG
jgi:DNA-binding CsgD family transcriptional regulator